MYKRVYSMSDFFNKIFKESMVGAVLVTTTMMLIGLLYIVPYFAQQQVKKEAFLESQRLISYLRSFRAYYAKDILSKVALNTDLYANFDHKTDSKTVPLPATLVHDLGDLFTKETDLTVSMYSNYPFPNREDRILDDFQKNALAFVLKNPKQIYSEENIIDGRTVFRTAIPDYLSEPSCVSCHNARVDTPKDDWKLGDVRGVIEVSIPLEYSFGSVQKLTYIIVLFILFNFSFLALYYFFFMKSKHKKLAGKVLNKDKLLSEYKKAVDLGAIVSRTNITGKITYANDAFIKISGYSHEELLGKSHSILRHPDESKETFEHMWKNLSSKKAWQGNIKNISKDGNTYFIHASIVPILDEYDNIVEYLAIRYDLTNLYEALEKANEAEKIKGRFLANMSHELRTPLNAIIGFSQILQRKKTLNEKDALAVEKIAISGKNLLTLVNSILDFSKIEEGEMEFNPSTIEIKSIFDEILVMFENQLQEKNINFSMFEYEENQTLVADKQLLKQSFINILSNAIKFTPDGGEIKISHTKEGLKHIFGICDNGEGISQEDIKTLFKPFKQGENAHTNVAKGTGLGLAITRSIIKDLHKGDIWVESELAKGSCFYISL